MKSHEKKRARVVRAVPVGLLAAASVLGLLPSPEARAGQRQFLVILANPPKTFGAPEPPGGLPNPQTFTTAYFDTTNPAVLSFAEYWKEISYGDVTISGRVTDWVQLPWPVAPLTDMSYVSLTQGPNYTYGRGEQFDNHKAAVIVDTNGDPLGGNDGPRRVEDNPLYARGAGLTTSQGRAVWTPGERFVDMDGDGKWDGYDEARNSMDWNNDGKPDLLGPWIDLNFNNTPDNDANCDYLKDSDNDRYPDCCPNGPGRPGCEGLKKDGTGTKACPATQWNGPNNTTITDCNGNLIDDAIDIVSRTSEDTRPYVVQGARCAEGSGDGIPDDCQYLPASLLPAVTCVATLATAPDDPCFGKPVCSPRTGSEVRTPAARCEWDDANGDGTLDVVEPFENFIARLKPAAEESRNDADYCTDQQSESTIRFNFPGQSADNVVARGTVRAIGGLHDPDTKITDGRQRLCADGQPYRTIGTLSGACPAGEHAQYDPPDAWTDVATRKIWADPNSANWLVSVTPEPAWYRQAWRDRYNGADPPPWQTRTPRVVAITSEGPAVRMEFVANRGGLDGRGTGWPDCAAGGFAVTFATAPCGDFEANCSATARIIPEERNGVGQPLILYDGEVEYDDLPSSKYHRAGDQQLGEVTSPFSNNIWGEDRGPNDPNQGGGAPDFILPASGPYATHLHGQLGRDAGNQLLIELLTRRTASPYNDGAAWEAEHGPHRLAGPSGANLGFRDYNLDGLIDLGETAIARGAAAADIFKTGNYLVDPMHFRPRGCGSVYPWNRRRLVEDCIQVLDDVIDFDDFVDAVSMDAVTCGTGPIAATVPVPFQDAGSVNVAGIVSGIVLLPAGSTVRFDFLGATNFFDPELYPIHNEDGLGDPNFLYAQFPTTGTRQLNWNLQFHDLVFAIGTNGEGGIPASATQTAYSAHEYLHTWEYFPDLYDYDIYDQPGPIENCPIGRWDIMADGGLVHPAPILKERRCTNWVEPVDLATVLTPGVDKAITLPAAEFVRDDSYFFIENENRLGERFYFWEAGSGFDRLMPGAGMLVLHTDVGSNPDALPQQQRSGDRPQYLIVQADGREDLSACVNRGDAGDPWPGSSNNTHFACDTNPASEWYTDNACTGLEVVDLAPDDSGSAVVTFNWTPTSIPSLKFIDPPGGVSVGTPPGSVIYKIRTEATDVYGGTWIRFFYTTQDTSTPSPATGTLIKLVRKTTPGTNDLSVDWNILGVPDGRYFLFADLIPDQGADGRERQVTTVRAGRNNLGTASLTNADVTVDTSTIANGVVTHSGAARSETWTVRCVDATAGKWVVGSSLTQPLAPGEPGAATCTANPNLCATTGTAYTSLAGAVAFTIKAGAGASPKGAVGDTFTFTTTGITAPSAGVTIRNGQIREDPTAIIDASPLSGPPPLTVNFDARRSIDPNGQPLQFRWDFGGGATATGAQTSHTYVTARTFTATLRATNPANSRFGEASVDISVTNNSPKAVIKATPTSGQGPLDVRFSATQSSDAETAADQLIYQWDYGDGVTANDQGTPGILREPVHTYARRADGTLCTTTNPCTFTATLKVTDGGGKSDTDSTVVRVGNTNPVANVSTTALQGSSPLTVTFNAKNSTDPETDPLEVEWQWGDGTPNEKYPAKTGKPPATDGGVPHTFTLPANTTSKTFAVKATVYDLKADGTRKGGETIWPGVNVTVTTAASGDSDPRAIFCFQVGTECETTTPTLAVDQSFTVDASRSFDNPTGGRISAYTWDWGDATPFATGVVQSHAYSAAGTYTITLTVADGDSPPHTGRTQKSVVVTKEGGEPPPPSTNHPPSAIFVISPPEAFVGEVVNFDARSSSDPDGDALRYRWVFGDGNQTQFTTNPRTTHTYASPGSYLVRLTVRDAANASTDATQTVRVLLQGENRSPVPMIATGPRAGTAPLTLTFDGRISYDPDGDAITSFIWEFRQNGELMDTMTGSVVTRVFETPGDYTVELVVKDGAGAEGRSEPQSILVTESSAPPPPEPPPPRPEPQEPPDSSGQRPKPTAMCGVGMLPGLLASLAGLTLTAMTRRRLKG
ncbi:MAG: PKD domain-containing protein [Planctomycetota bacterium]